MIRRHAADLANHYSGEIGFVYQHALKGFSVRMSSGCSKCLAQIRGSNTLKKMPRASGNDPGKSAFVGSLTESTSTTCRSIHPTAMFRPEVE